VLPFALHPGLELVADPSVLDTEELFFNAAPLDQSMALATSDYVELATPRVARIREQPTGTARQR
jgi:Ala-tRNA(Pro) deacylase